MPGIVRFSWWSLRGHWGRVVMLCVGLLCISLCTTLLAGFTQLSTLTATREVSHAWHTAYDLLVRSPDALSVAEQELHSVDPSAPEQTYGGVSLAQLNTVAHIAHVAVAAPEAVVGWITLRPFVPFTFTREGIYRVTTNLSEGVAGMQAMTSRFFVVVPLVAYTHLAASRPLPDTSYVALGNSGSATVAVGWSLQTLLSGIDPNAEAQLVGLHWSPSLQQKAGSSLPLLMNTHVWTPLTATMTIEEAQPPAASTTFQPANTRSYSWTRITQRMLNGPGLLTLLAHELGTPTQQSFALLQGGAITRYARLGYVPTQSSQLALPNTASDAGGPLTRFPLLPQAASPWLALNNGTSSFSTFDTTQLALHYENNTAPLGLYQPTQGGAPGLSPTHTVDSLPPLLLTTLAAACQLTGPHCISAIRVRVAGLGPFGARSESLLQQVAMDIQGRTGLHVDVITGASGHPLTVQVATANGASTLSEVWVQPYAAVAISSGVNAANLLLLIAAVSIALLALIAAALLAANGRVSDVQLLLDTGWSRALLLFEAMLEASVAALLAALPAWLISLLLPRLGAPSVSPAVVIGVLALGVLLYVVVVLVATQTVVSTQKTIMRRARPLWLHSSWWWMMFRRQVSWRRGSTTLVVIAMMGACGLICFMLLVQSAIDGILYATLLGREVQVSLSTTQTLAAVLTCVSAGLTTGLTLLLVVRERLPEFSTLLAIGWTRRAIAFEIVREGALLGLLGGLFGGAIAEVVFILLYHTWSWPLCLAYIVTSGVLGALLCVCSAVYPTLVALSLLSRRVLIES